MYSVRNYGNMLSDPVRMDAHLAAMRAAITPGCTVLDIGTGIGVTAIMACRLGARHVFAVEPSAAVEVGRKLAGRNGFADRITFIQGMSTEVTLPERCDVVMGDLRGALPFLQTSLRSLIDARDRHLAAGGTMIPRRDTVWIALAEAKDWEAIRAPAWAENLDITPYLDVVANSCSNQRAKAEALLSAPARWAVLDYPTLTDAALRQEVRLGVTRPGTAQGFSAWFDAELYPGIAYSTSPHGPQTVHGQGFFPFSAPVPVEPGDTVTVDLRAAPVEEDYVWTWNTVVTSAAGAEKRRLAQSSLSAITVEAARLRRAADSFVPAPSDDGRVLHAVLSAMNGTTPLAGIATQLQARFPDRFPSWQAAFKRVAAISQQYAR